MLRIILVSLLMVSIANGLSGEEVGSVDTALKLVGPNHKIVIEAFDDPLISGVTCYLSRAKKGGITGGLGLAEDPSDASISCQQTGPIFLPDEVTTGDQDGIQVFKKSTSVLFKKIQVVRFYDKVRNALIYLTFSDELIDGSPKNSISAIPIKN